MLTAEDRWMIGETVSLHGHLFDRGELDRLDELFTTDVTYDVSDLGFGVLRGIEEIRNAAVALGSANPLAHLVTNIVITDPGGGDIVSVQSKGLAVMSDRSCDTATYLDTLNREAKGWRISRRRVLAHRAALGGAG